MKILFLGGNLAKELADWLVEQSCDVIYREDKITFDEVKQIYPDMIISYNYKYIIPKEIIDYVHGKAINLHISYLPFNRGYHPNIWSFLEDTPKGVTIHYIDEGIDTGDIIAQKEVFIDEDKETLKSSYEILHKEIQQLFKENWEKIKNGRLISQPQTGGGQSTLKKNSACLKSLSEKEAGTLQSEILKTDITQTGLKLRNVESEDLYDLFGWRNNPDVRKNFFNTNQVSLDEHKKWFKEKINDHNTAIYMACYNEYKIGSVRFDCEDAVIKISVMLNPDCIGKGFGPQLIRMATERYAKERNPTKPIVAEVKKNNMRSIKAFQKAGFKECSSTHVLSIIEKAYG